MEPSSELLEILREIRDDQRELLALTRTSMEKWDRQYQNWREATARAQPIFARWNEANELWLKRNKTPRFAILTFIAIFLATIVILAAAGALGFLK